jgi:GrpB-like predicted nucleotidyltransferase (UPF0157 family)
MRSVPITLSEYDPEWPKIFEIEKQSILKTTSTWIIAVEHIGSTSIPGLIAKPIIDILAAVQSLDDAVHIIPPLTSIGYTYCPENEVSIPERRFFNKHPGGNDGFHLHVVEYGGSFWKRHIAFRNYLRTHPEAAGEYAELKRELAIRYTNDREQYTDRKTDFVQKIERLAGVTPSSELPL